MSDMEQLDDYELDIVEETPTEDDTVSLSKEELAKLQSSASTNEQIARALERLAPQPEQARVVDPFAVALNAEDLNAEELENELFERGKAVSAMDKYFSKRVVPVLREQQAKVLSMELRAELAENADLRPYEDEVRQLISALPPEKRIQPGIVQAAIGEVRKAHAEDIIEARVKAEVEKRLGGALVTGPEPGADFSEHNSRTIPSAKKRVTISSRQYAEYEQAAARKHMTTEDYIRYVVNG